MLSRTARVCLATIVALGAVAPRADAQRESVPRVALLCAMWCESLQTGRHEEGQAFLRELGQTYGRTVVLDERGAGVKTGLANVAAELVRRNVAVILADGLPAAQAAAKATTAIPVVMVGVADPVRLGLVASLARPGGTVTGVAIPFAELARKQLQLLREAVPGTQRVGILWNPDNPQHAPTLTAVEDASRSIGVEIRLLPARSLGRTELEGVFSALKRNGIRALLVLSGPEPRVELNLLAISHRVAAISMHRDFARGGGLMAYGPHRLQAAQRAAYFVDRILQGAKPGDLPVEEPSRYELIANVTTAGALGLTLPQSILTRADEVVR